MSRLNTADRELYARLADTLAPAAAEMPAASEAGVIEGFDNVLDWRPDLADDLFRAIIACRAREPEAAISGLRHDDPTALAALRQAVLGIYYLDAAVKAALEFSGQGSRPVGDDEADDLLGPDLLAPVMARGPIWRDPFAPTHGNTDGDN